MRAILIATGDEITQGDILNTTGPAIARHLASRDIAILKHVMVPDNEAAIQQAITEAIAEADWVFTTGGLGPTSDDVTRYALAKALNRELVFNEANWEEIVKRLTTYNRGIPESNKRQAYFPEGAEIFANPHGTAAGCGVRTANGWVFMLPGPPSECLPMVDNHILAKLPEARQHKLHWLLLGASEGATAEKMDAALTGLDCRTGYRADYPYLECKVWTKNAEVLTQVEKLVTPILEPFLVSKENIPASIQLQQKIVANKKRLTICDTATGGMLQQLLTTPATREYLQFINNTDTANITISGLSEYWQGITAPGYTTLQLHYHQHNLDTKLYYRDDKIRLSAAEWVCWRVLNRVI